MADMVAKAGARDQPGRLGECGSRVYEVLVSMQRTVWVP